jgi:hypothetical protein
MVSYQWSVINGQLSMVSYQWSIINGQLSRPTISESHKYSYIDDHWVLIIGHWLLLIDN